MKLSTYFDEYLPMIFDKAKSDGEYQPDEGLEIVSRIIYDKEKSQFTLFFGNLACTESFEDRMVIPSDQSHEIIQQISIGVALGPISDQYPQVQPFEYFNLPDLGFLDYKVLSFALEQIEREFKGFVEVTWKSEEKILLIEYPIWLTKALKREILELAKFFIEVTDFLADKINEKLEDFCKHLKTIPLVREAQVQEGWIYVDFKFTHPVVFREYASNLEALEKKLYFTIGTNLQLWMPLLLERSSIKMDWINVTPCLATEEAHILVPKDLLDREAKLFHLPNNIIIIL